MNACPCCTAASMRAGRRCSICAISCRIVDGAYVAGSMCPSLGRLRVPAPRRNKPVVVIGREMRERAEAKRAAMYPPKDGAGLPANMKRDGR